MGCRGSLATEGRGNKWSDAVPCEMGTQEVIAFTFLGEVCLSQPSTAHHLLIGNPWLDGDKMTAPMLSSIKLVRKKIPLFADDSSVYTKTQRRDTSWD